MDYAEDEIMPAFGYTGSATGTGAYYEDLLADLMGTGSGTYSYSNTVDDGSGNLLDGVSIQLATDSGGPTRLARTTSGCNWPGTRSQIKRWC